MITTPNPKKYKAAIVDDENCCANSIKESLSQFPEIEITGTAPNAKEGLNLIVNAQPDLLFIDVEMPDKTGLELMSELQNRISWDMHVVFHTAHNKYLIDALRTAAFDFLLKPYSTDEFNLVMNRFFEDSTKHSQFVNIQSTLSNMLPSKQNFMATTSKGFQLLKTSDIVYFEYCGTSKCWQVQLQNQKNLLLKRGTTAEDIEGYATCFIQISQKYIINFDYLLFIEHNECILMPPYENLKPKITRTFLSNLHKKFEMI